MYVILSRRRPRDESWGTLNWRDLFAFYFNLRAKCVSNFESEGKYRKREKQKKDLEWDQLRFLNLAQGQFFFFWSHNSQLLGFENLKILFLCLLKIYFHWCFTQQKRRGEDLPKINQIDREWCLRQILVPFFYCYHGHDVRVNKGLRHF